MSHALMNTYGTRALTFVRGEGSWLIADDGKRYLDAISGIAVCGLGHAHAGVAAAIAQQAATLVHTSNLYNIPQQQKLGTQLCQLAGMDKVFFGNSGAEANECAIKLARLYGHKKGIDCPVIVVMEKSFHGRTLATLTATGNRKVQAGFEPLVQGFVRAPYGDVEALKTIAANNPNVVAVLAEPVQGEGGVNIPAADYLNQLRNICDAHQWLLMLDEVQTGNGRTGKYFAYQHNNILPDVVTTAKGLGNGFPIGACLAQGAAAELFQVGNHGSTFGGSALACATAQAVVDTLLNEKLIERAETLGKKLLADLQTALADCSQVVAVRGLGLMLGIELQNDAPDLVARAAEKGVLINVTAGKVIRLLPTFVMTDEETALLVTTLHDLLRDPA
ncbi:MAG TPA: aspartate aminotransferase family protein [Pseudomonadales bacterium]|nr:aspartate aminotransferase family protein [Pseudomonadales bacterium]